MASSGPSTEHRVVLVGMMGAGKSTVGRLLADRLGAGFVDTDAVVELRSGGTIKEIFLREGEAGFRRMESDVLVETLAAPGPLVIAAGGGVVLDPANRRLLRDRARVVWLRAGTDILAGRVRGADTRPLLAGDPGGALARLAAERDALYREVADEVVDVDDLEPAQIVDLIGSTAP